MEDTSKDITSMFGATNNTAMATGDGLYDNSLSGLGGLNR